MSPLLIPLLALLIPIVAILAGTWAKVEKMKASTATRLSQATGHLEDELQTARADRDRLRQRIEALEAIVTSEGWDLEREARRAGLGGATRAGLADPGGEPSRLDPTLLDAEPAPTTPASRQRTRE